MNGVRRGIGDLHVLRIFRERLCVCVCVAPIPANFRQRVALDTFSDSVIIAIRLICLSPSRSRSRTRERERCPPARPSNSSQIKLVFNKLIFFLRAVLLAAARKIPISRLSRRVLVDFRAFDSALSRSLCHFANVPTALVLRERRFVRQSEWQCRAQMSRVSHSKCKKWERERLDSPSRVTTVELCTERLREKLCGFVFILWTGNMNIFSVWISN